MDGPVHSVNLCISRYMHKLQLATLGTDFSLNCPSCLLLEGMLRHVSKMDHFAVEGQDNCKICLQIGSLILHHVELCIGQASRPRTYRTSTDLCYKLCQLGGWDFCKLKNNANFKPLVSHGWRLFLVLVSLIFILVIDRVSKFICNNTIVILNFIFRHANFPT